MSWLNGLLAGKIGQEYSRGPVREEAVRDGAGARAEALATSTQLVTTAATNPARCARTPTILLPADGLPENPWRSPLTPPPPPRGTPGGRRQKGAQAVSASLASQSMLFVIRSTSAIE